MRVLIVIALLAVSACSAMPSRGIDWHVWTEQAVSSGRMLAQSFDPSAPALTPDALVASFEKIGFSFETRTIGVRNRTGDRYQVIRKWQHPLEYSLVSPPETIKRIQAPLDAFMKRLKDMTAHDIKASEDTVASLMKRSSFKGLSSRIVLLFGTDAFYSDILHRRRRAPTDVRQFVARWRTAASPCAGYVRHGSPELPFTGPLSVVVIAIRDEMPDNLMQACIEEELAQAMGLFNDDPSLRPSLFNDDQEYGVLTRHDELLLRILYDPRLKHGLPRARALPIIRQIASELLPSA